MGYEGGSHYEVIGGVGGHRAAGAERSIRPLYTPGRGEGSVGVQASSSFSVSALAGRPRRPVAVPKRLRGVEPSVMRVDWIPRPFRSFTWGEATRGERVEGLNGGLQRGREARGQDMEARKPDGGQEEIWK